MFWNIDGLPIKSWFRKTHELNNWIQKHKLNTLLVAEINTFGSRIPAEHQPNTIGTRATMANYGTTRKRTWPTTLVTPWSFVLIVAWAYNFVWALCFWEQWQL
jgi:hypothetical protein